MPNNFRRGYSASGSDRSDILEIWIDLNADRKAIDYRLKAPKRRNTSTEHNYAKAQWYIVFDTKVVLPTPAVLWRPLTTSESSDEQHVELDVLEGGEQVLDGNLRLRERRERGEPEAAGHQQLHQRVRQEQAPVAARTSGTGTCSSTYVRNKHL